MRSPDNSRLESDVSLVTLDKQCCECLFLNELELDVYCKCSLILESECCIQSRDEWRTGTLVLAYK